MISLLNKGQKEAADKIGDFLNASHVQIPSFTLTGGPGTGKTFMLKAALMEYKKNKTVICGTISHAARNVLSGALDNAFQCYTVAQLLGMSMRVNEADGSYYFVPDKYIPKRIEEAADGILVLDEVSMIDDALHALLMDEVSRLNIRCIAVGDPFQLPPVEQEHDSKFFDFIDATLTETMRFGGPVAKLAGIYHDAILSLNNDENVSQWILNEKTLRASEVEGEHGYIFQKNIHEMLDSSASYISDNYEDPNYTRILAFRNKQVKVLNEQIRKRIYSGETKQFEPGEIVICEGGYSADNKALLYNGEVLKVDGFLPVNSHPSGLKALKVKFKGMDSSLMPPVYTVPNDAGSLQAFETRRLELMDRAKKHSYLWKNYRTFMDSFAHFSYGYAQNLYKA